jgi:hypothetical protein
MSCRLDMPLLVVRKRLLLPLASDIHVGIIDPTCAEVVSV